ncbi:hypothetical protein OsJ_28775 [Oryza sativa Japonica Group]|uniref:Uncharacterized protein n=1 Tax=Oryza sativa subsp. japonica TaxID=39947 RepID=A3BX62_ORYSJ|nr:hypothetical protein OsJ_28775 [Oryza sativa Japonica Group]
MADVRAEELGDTKFSIGTSTMVDPLGYTCWAKHGEQELGSGAVADRSGADNDEEGDEDEHDMFIPSPLDGEMIDVDLDLLQDMLRDVEDPSYNEKDSMKFSRLVSDSEIAL